MFLLNIIKHILSIPIFLFIINGVVRICSIFTHFNSWES